MSIHTHMAKLKALSIANGIDVRTLPEFIQIFLDGLWKTGGDIAINTALEDLPVAIREEMLNGVETIHRNTLMILKRWRK